MKDALGAMHDFQAAIKNNPAYSLAYFNAANIYFKNRQYRQVRRELLDCLWSLYSYKAVIC